MKKINDYWVDDFNNRWSTKSFSLVKAVVISEPSKVSINEVSLSKFYGVFRSRNNRIEDRNFIQREEYDTGNFRLRCIFELTNGNGHPCWKNENLKKLIYELITNGWSVLEFGSAKELFDWLNN